MSSENENKKDGHGRQEPDKTKEVVISAYAAKLWEAFAKAAGKSDKVFGGQLIEEMLYESKKTLPAVRQTQYTSFPYEVPCKICNHDIPPNTKVVRIIGFGFEHYGCYIGNVKAQTWLNLSDTQIERDYMVKALYDELTSNGKLNMLLEAYQSIKENGKMEENIDALYRENSEMIKLLKDYFHSNVAEEEKEKFIKVADELQKVCDLSNRIRDFQKHREDDRFTFHHALEIILKGKTPEEFIADLKRKAERKKKQMPEETELSLDEQANI